MESYPETWCGYAFARGAQAYRPRFDVCFLLVLLVV